jgi:1,4-alpha-glucan branching enzyme
MAKKKADTGAALENEPVKKAAVKKVPVKKAAVKKAAAKKAPIKKASPLADAEKKKAPSRSKKALVAASEDAVVPFASLFTDFDIALFQSGKHFRLFEKFGAHAMTVNGTSGTYFAVWAPNARSVSVIGNFNYWGGEQHEMAARWDSSGIWEIFIPGIEVGEAYKYAIITPQGERLEKGDPYARFWELRPRTASRVWADDYVWKDSKWMKDRMTKNALNAPISVYEVHLASWMKNSNEPDGFLSYEEIADRLIPYVLDMGFTHVEFMPVMEHPFDGSWGYQVTGYFAPSSRFGSPDGFKGLVDRLHQAGIGVYLDWVPAHFPGDAFGPYLFDGTDLYEHEDPRKGFHPDWKSYIFNLGRNEVRSFMISNAVFWCDHFHADGLRVDAVASMLYLDYSRKEGEWLPNHLGGRENLESFSFFKELNEYLYGNFPGIQTIAEESTSWPGVSRPTFAGGLGFGMKWMMGWMNDSLRYFERDTYYRKYHQNELTFSLVYAFTENFMLPLSHDEVVHGKKSLVYKMPGDEWQRMANLRLLYLWMFTHPGTKLLFQGCEFAQTAEWNHQQSIDWHLLEYAPHAGIQEFVKQLNFLYREQACLHSKNFEGTGFEWLDNSDHENSVIVFMRKGNAERERIVIVLNLTPVPRENYRIGVPMSGRWQCILNSDAVIFGGSGAGQLAAQSEALPWQNQQQSLLLSLPPLGGLVFVCTDERS